LVKIFLQIITDPEWLQAIAAIATLPITLIAIIKLFKKDKERELQIGSLAQLAESQAEQLIEIRKQNEIFQSQLEISKDLHLMEKIKSDKENKERIKEIRPYFKCTNVKKHPEEGLIIISIINTGYTANELKICYSDCYNITFGDENKEMDKIVNDNKGFALKGKPEDKILAYTIRIEYSDDDGNRYFQLLKGNRINASEQEPVLISEKDTINA
jgi:hypothetical protein